MWVLNMDPAKLENKILCLIQSHEHQLINFLDDWSP